MAARILVVDDEPSIVKLVKTTLEGRGYVVDEAFDGQEAIVQAKLHKPDLILLDIMMPRMDGTEARKRLLADPETKDIPVIHLSAVGDFDKQRQALNEGATDYIVKPFAPRELARPRGRHARPQEARADGQGAQQEVGATAHHHRHHAPLQGVGACPSRVGTTRTPGRSSTRS